jgi:hypothetical protein
MFKINTFILILKNRMSSKKYFSLESRIYNYNSINKYLNKYYKSDGIENCLQNSASSIKKTFKLGEKIVTDNIIGEGSYGIVFSGHLFNLSLAIKILEVTDENILESQINKTVTKIVIQDKCPHFMIFYKILLCNKNSNLIELFDIDKKYKSAAILSNNEYYLILTELADGVFYDIAAHQQDINIINNCIIQCLFSIVFFNTLTNYSHDDAHLDNFLYTNIKPGGCFHYNIYGVDYYLKNVGYLIMINDFGLVVDLNINNLIKDINFFAEKLNNYHIKNIAKTLTDEMNSRDINKMDITQKQKHIYSLLFKLLSETVGFNNHLLTSKKPSLKIINKTPYIIR